MEVEAVGDQEAVSHELPCRGGGRAVFTTAERRGAANERRVDDM